ncbi:MAG: exo-alpha-sialidase [Clostridia bacterium]|nr:exo-alpha-sialidase [Clostridia bacterium]
MEYLADEYIEIVRTPKDKKIFAFTPAICVLDNGRYVFSGDLGGEDAQALPEMKETLPNPKGGRKYGHIFTSDDKGCTWQRRAVRNFSHARPFQAGGYVYVLGQSGDLVIYRSSDGGDTWDNGHWLTEGESWHQSACGYWIEDGYITLVMEQAIVREGEFVSGWRVANLAPVVLRARVTDDLTRRESWTFSNRVRFRDVVDDETLDLFGIPFFTTKRHTHEYQDGRTFTQLPGWLESNIVRITDPNHYWYDPSGRTFHILMRAHTAGSGYCCLMKAVVEGDRIVVQPQLNPSGRRVVFLPMPGGQMRFHILWDEKTKLFWLLSTQATDTMTRIECLSAERYNIPCDERDRLQLSFSKNLVDWCFAGMVAHGASEKQSRHYACMAIDGDDLVITSRSGDADTRSAHNTNLATFHRVKNFRELVY